MTTNEDNLITDNIRLAYKVAWNYYNKLNGFIDLEELQSLCFIGLVKASKLYNNDDYAFSTYAYKCMKNEILKYFNKIKNINKNTHISLSQEIGDELRLEDTLFCIDNVDEQIEKKLLIDKLWEFIDELDDIERKIIVGYMKGLTANKIGEIVGLKHARVSAAYKKALNKLRFKFYRNMEE